MAYTRHCGVNFGAMLGGLSATVTYALWDSTNVINPTFFGVFGLSSNTGVYEAGAGSGCYAADISIPTGFRGTIRWSTGGDTPSLLMETINPGGTEYLDAPISGVAASVLAAVVMGSRSLASLLRAMAAPLLGNRVNAADGSTTVFYDADDTTNSNPARVTSTQTQTTRQVTIH